jgi:hypothetical protein
LIDRPSLESVEDSISGNGVSIEDLRFGFAFEETGTGFSRANLGRFHLECLDVAHSSGSLNIHLFSIRGLLADAELPCLRRALDRVHQALLASFHSLQNNKPRAVYARLDQELKELHTAGYIFVAGNWRELPTETEVVGIVRVRRLMARLLNYLETRSALFTEAPRIRPGSTAKITTPIDTYVAGFLAVKGVSEKAYYSCLRALGTADADSPLADHLASSLASLAVIRYRFDQPQLSALLSNGSLSLPTLR